MHISSCYRIRENEYIVMKEADFISVGNIGREGGRRSLVLSSGNRFSS